MPDRKFDLSRRKILAGLGTVGVAGAGAGAGTTALFSDEETFDQNSIQAGTLDLVVDYVTTVSQDGVSTGSTTNDGQIQGGVSGQYQIADAKPGDSGFLAFCPKIVDNPGWLFVGSAAGVTDFENGQTEPEAEVDSTSGGTLGSPNDGQSAGELSEAIQVDVSYCEVKSGVTDPQGQDDYNTIREFNNPADYTLADLLNELESGFLLDGDADPANGTTEYPSSPDQSTQNGPCLCIDWEIPASVGNEIQSDAVEFDITFAARQRRNNPDPSNPFATTAVYPGQSIQSAIDGASSGDVISVFGGDFGNATDYTEELDIDTAVTLARASAERPKLAADAQDDNRAITVAASDVTIDGLDITFTGGAGNSPNAEKYGVEVQGGANNFTLRNSTVRDIVTAEAGRDGSGSTTDVNAVRSTGLTIKSPAGSGGPISAPTVRHNTFQNIECTGSTTQDGTLDSDSRAKGVALVCEVDDAEISGNDILGIGTASNDPSGAQISSVTSTRADVDGSSGTSRFTTSNADNQAAEGTDEPRGIDIIQGGGPRTPAGFVIENNVLGGTGSDAIVGVYGQPAIFVGGSGGIGSGHDVRGNDIYHPLDNLNGNVPLDLNGENTYYDTSGNTQQPSLVAPDADKDGGNLIDRAGGANYAGQP